MKINCRCVSKVYFTETIETHALSQVSIEIADGELVVISGPSGCGKSTLLAILGMLESPTSGTYLYEDDDTCAMRFNQQAEIRRSDIGFVFQSFNLIDNQTVLENVMLPLQFHRGLNDKDREKQAVDLLDRLGLSRRQEHYPTQLSGGQQQRVAIARALTGNPKLIIADEPTGNLDPESTENVIEIFKELQSDGKTLCVATHNPQYRTIADRVISLDQGRVIEQHP